MQNNYSFPSLRITSEKVLIILIILLAFAIRFGLLLSTDDFHGVSAGRIIRAELILKNDLNPGQWYSPVHPPVHLLLLVWGLRIFDNPIVTPRFISLFFGIALLLPFYYYIKSFFGKSTALFSLLAVAFYSEHIVYSVLGTSETCFHFFLFTGLLLLTIFWKKQNRSLLCISGLCIGLASLCRYEGLLFIPLIAFFIKRKFRDYSLFFISSLFLPIIWMSINYRYSGDAMQFINSNDFTVPLQYNWIRDQGIIIGLFEKMWFWPAALINSLGLIMFIAAMVGLGWCVYKGEKTFAALACIFLFGIFILRTIQERLYVQPRYAITIGLMLIPFGIFAFFRIIAAFNNRGKKIPEIIVLLLIASMIPSINARVSAEPLYTPFFAKDIASFLEKTIKEGENIIIDHCGDEKYREPIKLLSRINPKQFVLMPYLVSKDGRWIADKEKFFKVLEKCQVKFLVYSPYGDLKDILKLEKKSEQSIIDDFKFSLLYSKGPYLTYSVEKVNDEK